MLICTSNRICINIEYMIDNCNIILHGVSSYFFNKIIDYYEWEAKILLLLFYEII